MTSDWWLKFQRAEKHMVEINQEAVRYAERHPYSFTRIRWPDKHKQIRGRFRITEQPDPMIAVMLGDFVHNLRCALDYIIFACVPKQRRKSASFPVAFEDIFATDEDGEFVVKDDKQRESFETAIKGIDPEARAFIISLQPYQFRDFLHLGDISDDINLGIISRLENADKHRQLITIGSGGKECTIVFTGRDFSAPVRYDRILEGEMQILEDNTVIPYNLPPDGIRRPDGSFIQPSEMDMQLTTTAKILVKVTRTGGNKPRANHLIDSFMGTALFEVSSILNGLEPFIIE